MPERIATCCYCGRRTTLCVRNHALACGSCGAPLTAMKPLRPAQARAVADHPAGAVPRPMPKPGKGRKKKSKGFLRRLIEDVVDEIEDIFD
ncbi:hypothetical protein [Jannaschia rubra]|uniref:Uncharacterized protein n=1 Tax=Jannaschia rubra TaxID=282197 RepID=A0A0M6XPA4_9RHOB|nr:hypothetical protein [Jannaschia rubra]CTQ32041.1 hypothetical protein JAN5088_00801 [Jannaschia rubra]SFG39110.1 hypothetical protein SAMN04488517_104193 [Jannaschia rubra]